jgi:hypothetical protein
LLFFLEAKFDEEEVEEVKELKVKAVAVVVLVVVEREKNVYLKIAKRKDK